MINKFCLLNPPFFEGFNRDAYWQVIGRRHSQISYLVGVVLGDKSKMTEWDKVWEENLNPIGLKLLEIAEEKAMSIAKKNFRNNSIVVDVGCGSGRTLSRIIEDFPRSFGIDTSQNSLKLCKSRGLLVYDCDARKLDLEDKSVDVIFSEGLLEHSEDMSSYISEWCRVSKEYVLLIQPNPFSPIVLVRDLYWKLIRKKFVEEIPYCTIDYVKKFYDYGFFLKSDARVPMYMVMLFERIA